MKYFIECFYPLFIFIFFIIILCIFGFEIEATGHIAEITQLKEIVEELGVDARSEDILGQVAEVNRFIQAKKAYNEVFFIQIFIPNRYEKIELINIPKMD